MDTWGLTSCKWYGRWVGSEGRKCYRANFARINSDGSFEKTCVVFWAYKPSVATKVILNTLSQNPSISPAFFEGMAL